MNIPFVFHAATKSLFEKISPKKLFTLKINKQKACGYSLFTHCLFDNNKNEHDFYRGGDSIKKFCANLKKYAKVIINCEKKEIGKRKRKSHMQHKNFVTYTKKNSLNN